MSTRYRDAVFATDPREMDPMTLRPAIPVIGQALYCALGNHNVLKVTVCAAVRLDGDYDLLTTRIHPDEDVTTSDAANHQAHFTKLTYIDGECQNSRVFTERKPALQYALKQAQRKADDLTAKLTHLNSRIARLQAAGAAHCSDD